MKTDNQVDCYLYFMWNQWRPSQCNLIFNAEYNWEYIWDKWDRAVNEAGLVGAPAVFYAGLSEHPRELLVKAAVKFYKKHQE